MDASRLPAARRRTLPPILAATVITALIVSGCIATKPSPSANGSAQPSTSATAIAGTPTPAPGGSANPSPTTTAGASFTPGASPTSDAAGTATQTARAYIDALVAGHFSVAWKLLSSQSQKHWKDKAAFAEERGAYYATAGATYVLSQPDGSESARNNWLPQKFDGIRGSSYVIQADHPALAGNNAGQEVFVVAPIGLSADWHVWVVR
jgi:hypothetical protein